MPIQFLGHDAQYWLELQRRFETEQPLDAGDLLAEVVQLRGRLNFYESRIIQMHGQIPRDGKSV